MMESSQSVMTKSPRRRLGNSLFLIALATLIVLGLLQNFSSLGSTSRRTNITNGVVILRHPTVQSRIPPTTWKVWSQNATFPCYDPGDRIEFVDGDFPLKSFWNKKPKDYPIQGMLFVKPMKVGGSTSSGVQLRISKNMAERQKRDFNVCENSYDHVRALRFQGRDPNKSFLWSQLRDPTKRAVSYFWHMFVSKGKANATDADFRRVTKRVKDYYIKAHFLQGPSNHLIQATNMTLEQQYEWIIRDVLKNYDFIGVTERLDESLVVMNLLMNGKVPLGDMLYLSAKVHGGYDNLCNFLIPSNLTSGMKQYLESEEWQDIVQWDKVLYDAVNSSLDSTIDKVGRPLVENTLQRFKSAQQVVADRCQKEVKFGCTAEGTRRKAKDTNCLFLDSACAYECIDRVAEELGLA